VSVAVKKIAGVQSVNVSLNKGLVTIELAAGNHLTMIELRRVITANGFSPKEANVVVDGVLENRAGTPTLKSDGTNETFLLVPMQNAASAFEDVKRLIPQGAHAEINGRIDPPRGPEQLAVASVKPLREQVPR
jgi:copper chaperone CopZ